MQAKDVPDVPVLQFLVDHDGKFITWFRPNHTFYPTVVSAMPAETPEKVVLAKMRMLERRGFIDGCTCGCSGQFEITEQGRAFLEKHNESVRSSAGGEAASQGEAGAPEQGG